MEDAKEAAAFYEEKQRETNRPVNPREPLKRTANNNWIHVTCAVWTPEIKFGNAKALEPSEGIPSIQPTRYDEVCKICKMSDMGACVSCHQCKAICKCLVRTENYHMAANEYQITWNAHTSSDTSWVSI